MNTPKKDLLFSYGTFCDPAVQAALFGTQIPTRKGILNDWALYKAADGYLFIKPEAGHHVEGLFLSLTEAQLHRADQWEEIPYYVRERVNVSLADGTEEQAWVYARRGGHGELFEQSALSAFAPDIVLQAASALASQAERVTLPRCDMYMLVPCHTLKKRPKKTTSGTEEPDRFLESLQTTSTIEFSGDLARQLERSCLGDLEIVGVAYSEGDFHGTEIGRQRVRAYLTIHEPTRLGVIIFALPACSISPHHLLNQMTREDLRVSTLGSETVRSVREWMETDYLQPLGTPRATVILSEQPPIDSLRLLLAAEADPVDQISSPEISAAAYNDIAQYRYYSMYVSETCEVEVPVPFRETYELRIPDEALTVFIMELILLQEAALGRVSLSVSREIQRYHYASSADPLAIIENLGREFAEAMVLWNIRNFRYRTAQNLADHFSRAFRIEKIRENFSASRQLLEQLIEIHSTRLAERENKVVSALLVILTTLQVLPVLYLTILGLLRLSFRADEFLAAVVSLCVCGSLWLIFLSRRNRQRAKKALRAMLRPK